VLPRYIAPRRSRWPQRLYLNRARGSTAKLLQRRGVPLNVIQQIGGWEAPRWSAAT
jgi:hypothetical protein